MADVDRVAGRYYGERSVGGNPLDQYGQDAHFGRSHAVRVSFARAGRSGVAEHRGSTRSNAGCDALVTVPKERAERLYIILSGFS